VIRASMSRSLRCVGEPTNMKERRVFDDYTCFLRVRVRMGNVWECFCSVSCGAFFES